MKRQRPPRKPTKPSQAAKTQSPKSVKQRPAGVPSTKQIITELLIIFAVVILGVSTFVWWHYIESNPKRVFFGMIDNALRIPGGSVHITQSANGQTLDQQVQFSVSGQHVAHAFTTLSQVGSTAQTETVGTPNDDYVRYTSIKTTQLSGSGKAINFDNVIGLWSKADSDNSQTNGQLYNQIVLGVIPFGNLSFVQRVALLKQVQSAYQINYDELTRKLVNGRPQYTYIVQIVPHDYVVMLKQYAKDDGLTQLDGIDPASYNGASLLEVHVTVDVWSRQLVSLSYTTNNRVETFSQLGLKMPTLTVPTATISINDLESRLQTLQ